MPFERQIQNFARYGYQLPKPTYWGKAIGYIMNQHKGLYKVLKKPGFSKINERLILFN